jgi:hypothetical protein
MLSKVFCLKYPALIAQSKCALLNNTQRRTATVYMAQTIELKKTWGFKLSQAKDKGHCLQ